MNLYASTPIDTTPTNGSGKLASYRTSATALLIKVCLLTACIISLFVDLLQAQTAPIKEWDRRFGGSNDERIEKIIPTADGGYLLAGTSNSGINGDKAAASKGGYDYWVVKISSHGFKQWDKTFGGSSSDFLKAAIQTSDGGYLLAGTSSSGISGDKTEARQDGEFYDDYWVVKISSSGNKQWDKTFGGDRIESLSSVVQSSDGGYLLAGTSWSGISGNKTAASQGEVNNYYSDTDYWVVKISSNGTKQWDKTFGGSYADELASIIQTSDGGYLLGGKSESEISGNKTTVSKGTSDYWIVKITSAGIKQWDKNYGTDSYDELISVLQTSDGGYLLGGISVADNNMDKTGVGERWIIKVNSSGIKQWDISMDPALIFEAYITNIQEDIIKMADGGYLAIGNIMYFDAANGYRNSTHLHKINSNGQIQWSKKIEPVSGESVLKTGFQTSDGGFILAGYTDAGVGGDVSQPSKGGDDFWVVKTTREIQPGEIVMSSGSTGVSSCNTYYDPGFIANYQNNLNVIQTLSARAGYKLRLTFTSFQLENSYDKLYIYNGTSTSAPLIGVYTGSNSPGIITSSTGSLTFRFVSNVGITAPGWVANISYVSAGALRTAAEETAEEETQETVLKLEAFPNPFTEKITFNFTTQQTGPVSLRIYDSRGVEAADVFAAEVQAGETQRVEWKPRGHQPGVYIVRLATSTKVMTSKIVLVR